MEIKINVDDKLVQDVKDARSALAKIKDAIDKARKAACKWFDPNGLKLSEESEKKIGDAHLVYNQKIAEITNVVAESILGQKIDADAESGSPGTENGQQVKSDATNADAEPKTLRELAKLPTAEQVKKDASAEQPKGFDFFDYGGVKGITGMAEDGQVREYITVNDVDIAPLDKVEAITKQQAEGIFLLPSLAEDFMSLPVGVKRVAVYLCFAFIRDIPNESNKTEVIAYIRAVKSIIDLPDNDWPQLHKGFEFVGIFADAASTRAMMELLSDLSQKENAKHILNSICARQFAFVGEPKHAVYSRLSAAIKHENDKLDLPDDLNDEPKENTAKPEPTKEEKKTETKEPAATTEFPSPVEELPEFLARVKKANTKEDINKLSGEARVATTGSEAKGLVFYGDPFITNKDYALLQQALADREQELKKKEVKDFRFLRRASDFKSSFAVRIAYDLYRRIKGDKEVKFDHLRDIAGLLSDDKEKAQLLAEINTTARNVGELKE